MTYGPAEPGEEVEPGAKEGIHPSADGSTEPHTHAKLPSKKRLWWSVGIAGCLVLVAVLVAALTGVFTPEPELDPPVEKPSAVVTPEPTPEPEPEPEPEPAPVPDPTVVISDVLQMPYSEVWRPADEGENYWQIVDDAYGYPEDGGTDYLLAHSCENRACAGDDLLTLEPGETLTYQGELYSVDDRWTIMKTDIGAQDIWVHDPNRLVIVTCIIETTWQASDKNEIFTATRIS